MTMDAERLLESKRGQSVLEFLLMLPILCALAFFLIRVNTVVQMGIVNQQYGRAQALYLAFNSPYFPENAPFKSDLAQGGTDQWTLGVRENLFADDGSGGQGPNQAPKYGIFRPGTPPGDNTVQKEDIQERGIVRVRNTVTLCPQPISSLIGAGSLGLGSPDNYKVSYCGRSGS